MKVGRSRRKDLLKRIANIARANMRPMCLKRGEMMCGIVCGVLFKSG